MTLKCRAYLFWFPILFRIVNRLFLFFIGIVLMTACHNVWVTVLSHLVWCGFTAWHKKKKKIKECKIIYNNCIQTRKNDAWFLRLCCRYTNSQKTKHNWCHFFACTVFIANRQKSIHYKKIATTKWSKKQRKKPQPNCHTDNR